MMTNTSGISNRMSRRLGRSQMPAWRARRIVDLGLRNRCAHSRTRVLGIELLESRSLLAGDLEIAPPIVGENSSWESAEIQRAVSSDILRHKREWNSYWR